MSCQLDFGPYLGLFVADVPDSYLSSLPKITFEEEIYYLDEEFKVKLRKLREEVEREKEYRVKYKKWVEEDGGIHFGKGYDERSK